MLAARVPKDEQVWDYGRSPLQRRASIAFGCSRPPLGGRVLPLA